MLFDIYLITVLISIGINLSSFTNVLIKLKKYGYQFEKIYLTDKFVKSVISKKNNYKVFSIGIFVGIAMIIMTIIPSLIPIFNVILNINTINNWHQSINHFIKFLEKYNFIYNKYFCFFDDLLKNKPLFQITKLSYQHRDVSSKEMIESMYLDGVPKFKIKNELRKSKKERVEEIKKDKIQDIQKFENDMMIETELNCELSLQEKKKLLKLYKKALLSKRLYMVPIEFASEIATKNYIKTNK